MPGSARSLPALTDDRPDSSGSGRDKREKLKQKVREVSPPQELIEWEFLTDSLSPLTTKLHGNIGKVDSPWKCLQKLKVPAEERLH